MKNNKIIQKYMFGKISDKQKVSDNKNNTKKEEKYQPEIINTTATTGTTPSK